MSATASGAQTNAWAVRNSSINTGSGDDFVSLSASTFQTQWSWDPAYGADNSSINLGSGNDTLLIDANAAGLGDIQAYGSLNSSIKTGRGDDIVSIKAVANGGWGEQEGQDEYSYDYSGSWRYNSSGSWGIAANYSTNNSNIAPTDIARTTTTTTRPNTAIQVLTTTAGET